MADAAVQSLSVNAAKGSNPAARIFLQRLATAEARSAIQQSAPNPTLTTGLELKIAAWMFEATFGAPPPDPLPWADELDIDLVSGEVTFHRPIGRQDQAFWDACWMMRRQLEAELAVLTHHLADPAFLGLGVALAERRTVIEQAIQKIDCLLIAKWRLTPAELTAPPRHIRPGVSWERLQDEISPAGRELFNRARAVLLGQQLLRRSYEAVVGHSAQSDTPALEGLRACLLAHPGTGARALASLESASKAQTVA